MRVLRIVCFVAVLLAAFAVAPSPAEGSCAAPVAFVPDEKVDPGDTIRITGENWTATCHDTCGQGSCSGGCEIEPDLPMQNISLSLVRRGETTGVVLVERVDANDELKFQVDATIPADTLPGRYRLVATGGGSGGAPVAVLKVS
jgi:hypothetical protein